MQLCGQRLERLGHCRALRRRAEEWTREAGTGPAARVTGVPIRNLNQVTIIWIYGKQHGFGIMVI